MTAVLGKRILSARRVLQIPSTLRQCRNLHTSINRSKFFELRTYVIKPASFKDYLDLSNEKFHLRTAHSKNNGFWLSELGGLNEVTHLWEYDDFAHRTSVRQKLALNPDWQSQYIKTMLPYLDKQENVVLMESPLKKTEDAPLQEGGVYELCGYEVKKGCEDEVMQLIMCRAKLMEGLGDSKLMGLYSTEVGPNNSVYQLWNFKSLDKRQETMKKSKDDADGLSSHVTSMFNKIMIPCSFSLLK
ncbi:protein NipSnap homolog 3A-like [Asterias rubens]|uniref:protein NipSnap homolog 3A-like n=1 Tax=Asterias rubens TaxID=7604 RepID=UPI0014556E70|nr:protein NipSnap homolog 3A-like [Asterias rubens]